MKQDELKGYITSVFAKFLKIEEDKINSNAHFFELGGFSLLALNLISEVNKELRLSLSLETLIDNPTVEDFSLFIKPFLLINSSINYSEEGEL